MNDYEEETTSSPVKVVGRDGPLCLMMRRNGSIAGLETDNENWFASTSEEAPSHPNVITYGF